MWKVVLVAKYSSFLELHFKTGKSRIGGNGLDYCGSGQGQVCGSGGNDNEPSGSIKCGDVIDWLRDS